MRKRFLTDRVVSTVAASGVCAVLSVAMFCAMNVTDCTDFGTVSLQM